MSQRKSEAVSSEPETLIDDVALQTQREAENALRQADAVAELIANNAKDGETFVLRPSLLLQLNRLAIEGIKRSAGVYRSCQVVISGTNHKPPQPADVPRLVEEMCDYVNSHRGAPIHVASYLMWRVNWIHPFIDGNGRTTRAISYAMLCIRLGFALPGEHTIVELIAQRREYKLRYYSCLDAADAAWDQGNVDVSMMEEFMKELLALQLVFLHDKATGNSVSRNDK